MSTVSSPLVSDVVASPVTLQRATSFSRPRDLVLRGEIVPVRHGVYAPAEDWRALAPWERYLARVHATALIMPDVAFCLESAAALRGLPAFGEPEDVHVLRDPRGTSRHWSGVRTHTTDTPRAVETLGGLTLTSPEETAVDIARCRHRGVALAVADAVLRADAATSVEHLVAINESRSSSRGRRHARWALHRCDGAASNPLESVSRAVIEWLGFESPELQERFEIDGSSYFTDFFWRMARVVGEADGRVKYDGTHGDPTTAVFDEKRREDALRRHVSGFARWGWPEVHAPRALRTVLLAAGLRPAAPEDTESLAGLPRALAGRAR